MNKLLLVFAVVLSGCSYSKTSFLTHVDSSVMQVIPGVFEILREDYRGVFGTEGSLIEEVVSDADEFAHQQGNVAVPIQGIIRSAGFWPSDRGWFYYVFRVAAKSDTDTVTTIRDIMITRDQRGAAQFKSARGLSKNGSSIVADQLIGLDELRTSSVITYDEFELQKMKLLTAR